jgi:hypothetical protein
MGCEGAWRQFVFAVEVDENGAIRIGTGMRHRVSRAEDRAASAASCAERGDSQAVVQALGTRLSPVD